jgi:hypothetical protein
VVELAPALLAGILAAQIAQVGFEAKLLKQTAQNTAKIEALWSETANE